MSKKSGRSNYILELNSDNKGFFAVKWKIPILLWESTDELGIYENASTPKSQAKAIITVSSDSGTNNFSVAINPGYELRYYKGNTEIYRTSSFPKLILGMTNNNYFPSAKANIESMKLTYKDGVACINSIISNAKNDDFIGLYDSLLAENEKFIFKIEKTSFNQIVNAPCPISNRMFLRYITKHEDNLHMVRRTFQMLDEISVHEKLDENLDDDDKYQLMCAYPKLALDLSKKTDVITNEYNCISWSLGFDNRWINPLGSIDKMVQFYEMYGCKEETITVNQKIDLWATANLNPTHGSKFYKKEASEAIWESKLGSDYRITHNRDGVESGVYGEVVRSFTEPSLTNQHIREKREWSNQELNCIESQINMISIELQHEFEAQFLKWKNTWFTGNSEYSSNINDLKEVKEYEDLLELGESVIPMVIKKLCDEENFPAIVLYDQLQCINHLKLYSEKDFDVWIMGEQERAVQTIVKWIEHRNK